MGLRKSSIGDLLAVARAVPTGHRGRVQERAGSLGLAARGYADAVVVRQVERRHGEARRGLPAGGTGTGHDDVQLIVFTGEPGPPAFGPQIPDHQKAEEQQQHEPADDVDAWAATLA